MRCLGVAPESLSYVTSTSSQLSLQYSLQLILHSFCLASAQAFSSACIDICHQAFDSWGNISKCDVKPVQSPPYFIIHTPHTTPTITVYIPHPGSPSHPPTLMSYLCRVYVSELYVLYSYNGHLDAMHRPTHPECTCVSVKSHSHCSCSSSFTNTALEACSSMSPLMPLMLLQLFVVVNHKYSYYIPTKFNTACLNHAMARIFLWACSSTWSPRKKLEAWDAVFVPVVCGVCRRLQSTVVAGLDSEEA